MKIKTLISTVLIFGFTLSLASLPGLAAQKKNAAQRIFIPDKVKSVFQEGMQTREARLDIPFAITKHLYLPARENVHSIFFFKIKNADLGFSSAAAAVEPKDKKEKEEKIFESSTELTPPKLQTKNHVFLQFKQLDGDFTKEIYMPFGLEVDSDSYEPEKEEIYSTGYPLPPGNYLLSMAIASQNLEKIGTQYFEFTLPSAASFTEGLETTPIFFNKKINQMSAPESTTNIHKGFFTYSILQIEPNLDRVFSKGDNLDIFFFIYGTQPNPDDPQKVSIEITYSVLKGEEAVIRYAPQKYDALLVSQPLPLKRTVIIKTTKEGKTEERKETKDLEPGTYILNIDIKDTISGKTLKKTVDFECK